jgi:hypothetical protein
VIERKSKSACVCVCVKVVRALITLITLMAPTCCGVHHVRELAVYTSAKRTAFVTMLGRSAWVERPQQSSRSHVNALDGGLPAASNTNPT